MKRYGVEGGKGTGGQHMPFARAVEADGWLFVSGQTPMENGEVIEGGIVPFSKRPAMAPSMWFGVGFGWMIRGILLRLIRCSGSISGRIRRRGRVWFLVW
jgi:hypothetical protein